MSTFRLGVDAINLLADERGMGRVVRGFLRYAVDATDIDLTLLARKRMPKAAYAGALARDRFSVARLARARRRDAFDAVLYPWNGIRFASRAPSLVIVYDAFAFTEPARGWIARRREQGPIRRAARSATQILTISEWSRSEIARALRLDPARIEVALPEPSSFWSPGAASALPPELVGKRFILCVGGVEERKNVATLIDAYRSAFEHGDPRLVVAGSLNARDEERAAEVGAIRVRPSDDVLRSLYRAATCVAVPSRAEGFGLVAAEAMACAAAVVASDASALPEVTGDAALLVPPDDITAWSHALRRLTDDETMSGNYRARAAARWAFAARDRCAKKIVSLLHRIAGP